MSAIERCRTAELGGHLLHCPQCETEQIAYNSCRNRHCPKCQASAARRWLEARQAELLPVEYYHVVFTLPAPISDIAYQNKSVIYSILFKAASETLLTIARDPKHLGAQIGVRLGPKLKAEQLRVLLALLVLVVCAKIGYDLVRTPDELFTMGARGGQ